ncbi:cell division protein FtsL [Salsuginibacillus kocurii]|uniref:cell division protein FtsL n=1 Tax=Salsuginibacillus kocurii TaxID=427078 RepID=UPI000364D53F|nr:cell division protein FtsL [Salsuginibacillus kocurii]
MQQYARQQEFKSAPETVHKTVQKRLPGKITKGEKLLFLFVTVIIAIVASVIISNYAHIHTQEREISTLNTSVQEQQEINESLYVQVSELSAPDRIIHYATEELNMSLQEDRVRVVQD